MRTPRGVLQGPSEKLGQAVAESTRRLRLRGLRVGDRGGGSGGGGARNAAAGDDDCTDDADAESQNES